MLPRINSEGQYTSIGTIGQDGKLLPYTQEEIERTRAYETAHGIPSTLPVEVAPVEVAPVEVAPVEVAPVESDEAEDA